MNEDPKNTKLASMISLAIASVIVACIAAIIIAITWTTIKWILNI